MSKTAPGPKELAQRAMQEARVAKGKRQPIPYAGFEPRRGRGPTKKKGLVKAVKPKEKA